MDTATSPPVPPPAAITPPLLPLQPPAALANVIGDKSKEVRKHHRKNSHSFVARISTQLGLPVSDIHFCDTVVQLKRTKTGIVKKNIRLLVVTDQRILTFVEQEDNASHLLSKIYEVEEIEELTEDEASRTICFVASDDVRVEFAIEVELYEPLLHILSAVIFKDEEEEEEYEEDGEHQEVIDGMSQQSPPLPPPPPPPSIPPSQPATPPKSAIPSEESRPMFSNPKKSAFAQVENA